MRTRDMERIDSEDMAIDRLGSVTGVTRALMAAENATYRPLLEKVNHKHKN